MAYPVNSGREWLATSLEIHCHIAEAQIITAELPPGVYEQAISRAATPMCCLGSAFMCFWQSKAATGVARFSYVSTDI